MKTFMVTEWFWILTKSQENFGWSCELRELRELSDGKFSGPLGFYTTSLLWVEAQRGTGERIHVLFFVV